MEVNRENAILANSGPPVLSAVILLILLACLSVSGQVNVKNEPWLTKDWTEWTMQDCHEVLVKSPWTHSTAYDTVGTSPYLSSVFSTTIQLRSALPIRQALLRQLQLQKHYDKMKAQQKQEFDNEHQHDLDPTGQILVFIEHSSSEPVGPGGSTRRNLDVVGPDVARQAVLWLSDGGPVPPSQTTKVNYNPAGIDQFTNEYEYAFPRTLNGRPLYSTADLYLEIDLGDPLVTDKKTGKVVPQDFRSSGFIFTFEVSALMYKGKLEY